MNRVELIQSLIDGHHLTSYLELGVHFRRTFDAIECDEKQGVEPDPPDGFSRTAIFKGTSDDFFAQNVETFGVTFVDGLHHAGQCLRDINNALEVSRFVVIHDVDPVTEAQTQVPRGDQKQWTGDVHKAWASILLQSGAAITYLDDWGLGLLDSELCPGPFEMEEACMDLSLEDYRVILHQHAGTRNGEGLPS